MLVKRGEHEALAHLLMFMVLGERLAHECAKTQREITPDKGIKTFLTSQARQEHSHAIIFEWAIRWLTPREPDRLTIAKQMAPYRQRLEGALQEKNLAETLLAEQIILEGMGEAILKKLEAGLVKRGAPFQRLRKMLIHQEEAHHQFGLRVLDRMLEKGETDIEDLNTRGQLYLSLAETLLYSVHETFSSIDEHTHEYWEDFLATLPPWLRPHQPSIPFVA